MPLRARARHADVDHGGDRPRRHAGVLFRDAEAIELLRRIDTLIVDKTGTLTLGKPAFRDRDRAGALRRDEVLRLAASLDQGSEHPLADAIVAEARRRGLALSPAEDSNRLRHRRARQRGRQALALGNTVLMKDVGVDVAHRRGRGATAARGRERDVPRRRRTLAGLLAVADPIKDTTPEAMAALQAAVSAS